MAKSTISRLAEAFQKKWLVSFERSLEPGHVLGYIVDIGPKFFMVLYVEDGMRYGGFQCFRLKDVRRLQAPHKYADFVEAALKKRAERRPRKPKVSMADLGELLRTANKAYPMVTIHREKVKPHVCHIGRVADVTSRTLALMEIGPDALWDEEPSLYKMSEITRVDFGGAYEEALHLVGGSAPKYSVRGVSQAGRKL